MSRAEYMREYRKRQRLLPPETVAALTSRDVIAEYDRMVAAQGQQIADLLAEVKHLKAELAKRVTATNPAITAAIHGHGHTGAAGSSFNTRPFRPVPKK